MWLFVLAMQGYSVFLQLQPTRGNGGCLELNTEIAANT